MTKSPAVTENDFPLRTANGPVGTAEIPIGSAEGVEIPAKTSWLKAKPKYRPGMR